MKLVTLGVGINTLTAETAKQAFVVKEATAATTTTTSATTTSQGVEYLTIPNREVKMDTSLATSLEELKVNVTASLAAQFPQGITTSFDLSSIREASVNDLFFTITMSCTEKTQRISGAFVLNADIEALLAGNELLSTFVDTAGTEFVDSITFGRIAVIIIHVHAESKTQQTTVGANLSGLQFTTTQLKTDLKKTLQSTHYNAHVFTQGMDGANSGILMNLDQINVLAQAISAIQTSEAVQLSYTSKPYQQAAASAISRIRANTLANFTATALRLQRTVLQLRKEISRYLIALYYSGANYLEKNQFLIPLDTRAEIILQFNALDNILSNLERTIQDNLCDAATLSAAAEEIKVIITEMNAVIAQFPRSALLPIDAISSKDVSAGTHKNGEYEFSINPPDQTSAITFRIRNKEQQKWQAKRTGVDAIYQATYSAAMAIQTAMTVLKGQRGNLAKVFYYAQLSNLHLELATAANALIVTLEKTQDSQYNYKDSQNSLDVIGIDGQKIAALTIARQAMHMAQHSAQFVMALKVAMQTGQVVTVLEHGTALMTEIQSLQTTGQYKAVEVSREQKRYQEEALTKMQATVEGLKRILDEIDNQLDTLILTPINAIDTTIIQNSGRYTQALDTLLLAIIPVPQNGGNNPPPTAGQARWLDIINAAKQRVGALQPHPANQVFKNSAATIISKILQDMYDQVQVSELGRAGNAAITAALQGLQQNINTLNNEVDSKKLDLQAALESMSYYSTEPANAEFKTVFERVKNDSLSTQILDEIIQAATAQKNMILQKLTLMHGMATQAFNQQATANITHDVQSILDAERLTQIAFDQMNAVDVWLRLLEQNLATNTAAPAGAVAANIQLKITELKTQRENIAVSLTWLKSRPSDIIAAPAGNTYQADAVTAMNVVLPAVTLTQQNINAALNNFLQAINSAVNDLNTKICGNISLYRKALINFMAKLLPLPPQNLFKDITQTVNQKIEAVLTNAVINNANAANNLVAAATEVAMAVEGAVDLAIQNTLAEKAKIIVEQGISLETAKAVAQMAATDLLQAAKLAVEEEQTKPSASKQEATKKVKDAVHAIVVAKAALPVPVQTPEIADQITFIGVIQTALTALQAGPAEPKEATVIEAILQKVSDAIKSTMLTVTAQAEWQVLQNHLADINVQANVPQKALQTALEGIGKYIVSPASVGFTTALTTIKAAIPFPTKVLNDANTAAKAQVKTITDMLAQIHTLTVAATQAQQKSAAAFQALIRPLLELSTMQPVIQSTIQATSAVQTASASIMQLAGFFTTLIEQNNATTVPGISDEITRIQSILPSVSNALMYQQLLFDTLAKQIAEPILTLAQQILGGSPLTLGTVLSQMHDIKNLIQKNGPLGSTGGVRLKLKEHSKGKLGGLHTNTLMPELSDNASFPLTRSLDRVYLKPRTRGAVIGDYRVAIFARKDLTPPLKPPKEPGMPAVDDVLQAIQMLRL